MAIESGIRAILLLIGRLIFGGLLAFSGLNHFLNTEVMAEGVQSKGVPAAKFNVIATGMMLVLGGLGVILGIYPIIHRHAISLRDQQCGFHHMYARRESAMGSDDA